MLPEPVRRRNDIPETFQYEEPEIQQGRIVEIAKLALIVTLPATTTAAVLLRDENEMEIKQIALAAAMGFQLAFFLGYVVSKSTRTKCYKVVHRMAYVIYFIFWNLVINKPGLAITLFVPISLYFAGFGNELINSTRRTRLLIENGDIIENDPLSHEDRTPFFYPHTEGDEYIPCQLFQSFFGALCLGGSYALNPEGPAQLLRLGGAMLTADGLSAAAGNLLERTIARKNREVIDQDEIPLLNSLLTILRENIGTVQKFAALASAFVTNEVASFAILASAAGLTRQHKQRSMVMLEGRVQNYHDSFTDKIIGYIFAGALAVVIPYYTFHCHVGDVPWYSQKCPEGRNFFDLASAESLTFGFFLSFALAELIKRRWGHAVEGGQPLAERSRVLNTARLALVECSDINAYISVLFLHIAQGNMGSFEFRSICYLLGIGGIGGAGGEISRMFDPYLSDRDIPQMSPFANIAFTRTIGMLLRTAWSK